MKKKTILLILSLVMSRVGLAEETLKPRALSKGTEVNIREPSALVSSSFIVEGESLFIIPRSVLERATAEKTVTTKLTKELEDCYFDLESERSKNKGPGMFYKLKWLSAGLAIAGVFYLGSKATK